MTLFALQAYHTPNEDSVCETWGVFASAALAEAAMVTYVKGAALRIAHPGRLDAIRRPNGISHRFAPIIAQMIARIEAWAIAPEPLKHYGDLRAALEAAPEVLRTDMMASAQAKEYVDRVDWYAYCDIRGFNGPLGTHGMGLRAEWFEIAPFDLNTLTVPADPLVIH